MLRAKYSFELIWGCFAAANLVVMGIVPGAETVPFHFIWVSLTLVYGFRVWSTSKAAIALVGVSLATAPILTLAALRGDAGFDEVTEVPLMAAMFAVMVLHASRRQAALAEVHRLGKREEQLARERAFTRDASHQLRTPIAIARGYAELIAAAPPGRPPAEDARVIIKELDRLSRISDRFLLLATADRPHFLRRAPVGLEGLLASVGSRWEVTAKRQWKVAVAAQGTISVDTERLESALDALLENAVRHTADGDRIAIVGRAEGDTAVIEILDNGEGIPSDLVGQIFESFGRVDQDRSRRNGGTGLGLAIVKAIAEAHGGSVSAKSLPGVETSFRIHLPGFEPSLLPARAAPSFRQGLTAGT